MKKMVVGLGVFLAIAAQAGQDGAWKMFDRRMGLFVHWGVYAVDGWQEQTQWRRGVPVAEYEKLMLGFRLRDYDPEKWLDLVEAAGMEYVVITTKHHDGFCMWDTDETDYKITRTPGGRDVVRELADACHRRGIRLGFYYSYPDWHHPNAINFGGDHQLKRPNPGAEPDFVKYLAYIKRQVTELLTRYGRIDCFFWDTGPSLNIPEMNDLVRRLQPGILINPRGFGPGDYSTPERGGNQLCGYTSLVEGCDSVDAESWGYRADADYRTVGYCARWMARLLSRGGNFLLNVGPDADGRIPAPAQDLLRRLGACKKAVGEAWKDVQNVAGVVKDANCIVTKRGETLYLTYTEGIDRCGLNLKPLDRLPRKATLLNTGLELKASVVQMPSNYNGSGCPKSLHLQGIPADDLAGMPVVIKLEY